MDPMGNISQPWGKENHFQKCFGKGYVSSQEGNSNANVWFQAAKVLTERILSQIIDMKFEVNVFGGWKLWVKTLLGCVRWGNVTCAHRYTVKCPSSQHWNTKINRDLPQK